MIEIMFGALMFCLGIIAGWIQRDSDKKRDAGQLAEYILRQCEEKPTAKLKAFK